MSTQEIKALLDKYFEAETSLQEEKQLRTYFSGSQVDASLHQYSPLFKAFAIEETIVSTKDYTAGLPKSKQLTKNLDTGGAKIFTLRKFLQIAVAASFLAVASFLVVKYMMPQVINTKTTHMASNYIEVENPQEAIEYTEDAIRILAKVFKTSEKQLETGMGHIDKAPVIGGQD